MPDQPGSAARTPGQERRAEALTTSAPLFGSQHDPGRVATTVVRDRAVQALRELTAIARDCFGADMQGAALAAVSKAAGVRLVLSFIDDADTPARTRAG